MRRKFNGNLINFVIFFLSVEPVRFVMPKTNSKKKNSWENDGTNVQRLRVWQRLHLLICIYLGLFLFQMQIFDHYQNGAFFADKFQSQIRRFFDPERGERNPCGKQWETGRADFGYSEIDRGRRKAFEVAKTCKKGPEDGFWTKPT